jgi:uncharacterized delta-60 repeat protein
VLDRARPSVVLHHWWNQQFVPDPLPTFDERWICVGHAPLPMPGGYDAYVSVSGFHRRSQGHLPRERVRLIPNGVDLARFRPDGTLDPDFGQHGFTVTAPAGSRSERLSGIVLQPDGKIVVGGQVAKGESGDFALLRYSPQGALDSSFGEGGLVTVDFAGREDQVRALFLQPDGKIVGVGPSETDFALVRLHGGG